MASPLPALNLGFGSGPSATGAQTQAKGDVNFGDIGSGGTETIIIAASVFVLGTLIVNAVQSK